MPSNENIQNMNPYEFEELISDIWVEKGFKTNVRSKSKDRGVDVVAVTAENAYKEVIQAKCYSGDNKVGSQEVRKYATLYQQIPTANSVVIVTASGFTADAKLLANDLNVKIYNGNEIIDEINTYDVSLGNNRSSDREPTGNTQSVSDQQKRMARELMIEASEALDEFFELAQEVELYDVDDSHGLPRLTSEAGKRVAKCRTDLEVSVAGIEAEKKIIASITGEDSTDNYLRVLNSAESVLKAIKDLDRHRRDSASHESKSLTEAKKDQKKIDIGKKVNEFNTRLQKFDYKTFTSNFLDSI